MCLRGDPMAPHRALKFGLAVRTPAIQAGLARRPLTLREIFCSRMVFRASANILFALFDSLPSVRVECLWRFSNNLLGSRRLVKRMEQVKSACTRGSKMSSTNDSLPSLNDEPCDSYR
jgi:hypothetical protein